MDEQQQTKQSLFGKLKSFIYQCKIVLRVTKKPTKQEFNTVLKVSAIGIIIIGIIGFIIQILDQVLIK